MQRQTSGTPTLVKQEVRRLLDASPAYRGLPAAERRQLAGDTVRIGVYLAEPEGIRANGLAGAITVIPAGNAARTDLLAEVNFPAFVGGLIHGVFQAIVNSSIEQMHAYADLVKNIAQTVDKFASAAISDQDARDWLAKSYADCLERDEKTGKIRQRRGADCADALVRLRFLLDPGPPPKLTPDDIEKKLVPAARRRLAADRQQLLATMTLMGVNRIVVAN